MSDNAGPSPIQIRKYPNRRYYDMLHSRHITLQEVHDLIISGHDVVVTDSRTSEDITNFVLMQILLEKDHPKLDLFPSSILHMMIRSNRQVVRNTVERFFGPFLGLMAASQKQFDAYMRKAIQGQLVSPLDWADGIMRAFGGENAPARSVHDESPSELPDESVDEGLNEPTLTELRSQIDALRRRIEQFTDGRRDAEG